LGAGLGLGGIGAALAGAREVTLFDREPLALACAELTVVKNGLRLHHGDPGTVGDPRLSVQVLDWADASFQWDGGLFDVVMACDVLYMEDAVAAIIALLPKLLKPGGSFLLADPPHRTPQNRERFVKMVGAVMQKSFRRKTEYQGVTSELCIMQFKLP